MQKIITPNERWHRARILPAEPGPYVKDGFLGFVMLDGSKVLCQCITDPLASKIVELYSHAANTAAAANRDAARAAEPVQGPGNPADVPPGSSPAIPDEGKAQSGEMRSQMG